MQQPHPGNLQQVFEHFAAVSELARDVFGQRQATLDHLFASPIVARVAAGDRGEFLQQRLDVVVAVLAGMAAGLTRPLPLSCHRSPRAPT